MNITLTIPDNQVHQLEYLAQDKQRSLETFLTELLLETIRQKLASDYALQQLVTETKTLPYNPHNLRPATGSLLEALQNCPEDPEFDLEVWTEQWAAIETEMKLIDQANDINTIFTI